MGNVIDDSSVTSGLSWGGFNLSGNMKSIGEVRRLLNQEERLRWFECAYRELLDAKCPCQIKRAADKSSEAEAWAERVATEGLRP